MALDEIPENSVDPRLEALGLEFAECRRKLVRFFSVRGRAFAADELADETILRMIGKVRSGVVIENVGAYALTVGRLVLLEGLRRPQPEPLDVDPPAADDHPPDTEALDCLEHALDTLPPGSRDVILRFYGLGTDDPKIKDARKRLAEDLRMTRQALDSRASRSRRALEKQVRECLERTGPTTGMGTFSHSR